MNWISFTTSLFGACLGALGAYCVALLKERRDEAKERRAAIHAAQYALHTQWSILHDIKTSFLDPVRNDPNRHTTHQIFLRNQGEQSVPLAKLTFLLDSKEPNLLQEVHIAENRFLASIRTLDKLNELRGTLLQKYPPSRFDLQTGAGLTEIPSHELFALKTLTDLLYRNIDEALVFINQSNHSLAAFTVTHLRGCKALAFELVDRTTVEANS